MRGLQGRGRNRRVCPPVVVLASINQVDLDRRLMAPAYWAEPSR